MTTLYVGSLHPMIDQEMIAREFIRFGEIKKVTVIRDRMTGFSRGFGYISFFNPASAATAQKVMDGQVFNGRPIKVNFSRTDQPYSAISRDTPASKSDLKASASSNSKPPEKLEDKKQQHNKTNSMHKSEISSGEKKSSDADKNLKTGVAKNEKNGSTKVPDTSSEKLNKQKDQGTSVSRGTAQGNSSTGRGTDRGAPPGKGGSASVENKSGDRMLPGKSINSMKDQPSAKEVSVSKGTPSSKQNPTSQRSLPGKGASVSNSQDKKMSGKGNIPSAVNTSTVNAKVNANDAPHVSPSVSMNKIDKKTTESVKKETSNRDKPLHKHHSESSTVGNSSKQGVPSGSGVPSERGGFSRRGGPSGRGGPTWRGGSAGRGGPSAHGGPSGRGWSSGRGGPFGRGGSSGRGTPFGRDEGDGHRSEQAENPIWTESSGRGRNIGRGMPGRGSGPSLTDGIPGRAANTERGGPRGQSGQQGRGPPPENSAFSGRGRPAGRGSPSSRAGPAGRGSPSSHSGPAHRSSPSGRGVPVGSGSKGQDESTRQRQLTSGIGANEKPGLLGHPIASQKPGLLGSAPLALNTAGQGLMQLPGPSQSYSGQSTSNILPTQRPQETSRPPSAYGQGKGNGKPTIGDDYRRERDGNYSGGRHGHGPTRNDDRSRSSSSHSDSKQQFRRSSETSRSSRNTQQSSNTLYSHDDSSDFNRNGRKRQFESTHQSTAVDGEPRYSSNRGQSNMSSKGEQRGNFFNEPSPKRATSGRQSNDSAPQREPSYSDYRSHDRQRSPRQTFDDRQNRENTNDRRDHHHPSLSDNRRGSGREADDYRGSHDLERHADRDTYGSSAYEKREPARTSGPHSRDNEREFFSNDTSQSTGGSGVRNSDRLIPSRDDHLPSRFSKGSVRDYHHGSSYQEVDNNRASLGNSAVPYRQDRPEPQRGDSVRTQDQYGKSSIPSLMEDQANLEDWRKESRQPLQSSDFSERHRSDLFGRAPVRDQSGYVGNERQERGGGSSYSTNYSSGEIRSDYSHADFKQSEYQEKFFEDSRSSRKQDYAKDIYQSQSSYRDRESFSSHRQPAYREEERSYISPARKREYSENSTALSNQDPSIISAKRNRSFDYDKSFPGRSGSDDAVHSANIYQGRPSSEYVSSGTYGSSRPTTYSSLPSNSGYGGESRMSTSSSYSAQNQGVTERNRSSYQQYGGSLSQASEVTRSREAPQYDKPEYVGYGSRQSQDRYGDLTSRFSSDRDYKGQLSNQSDGKLTASQPSLSGYSSQTGSFRDNKKDWGGYDSKSLESTQKMSGQYESYRRPPAAAEPYPASQRSQSNLSDNRGSQQTSTASLPWQHYNKSDTYSSGATSQNTPDRYGAYGRTSGSYQGKQESYGRGSYSSTGQSPGKSLSQHLSSSNYGGHSRY